MGPIQVKQTENTIEYTMNEVGSDLYLQFHVVSNGEDHPATPYLSVYYSKPTSFTPVAHQDGYYFGCRVAHPDYLISLVTGGVEGLIARMEDTYRAIKV
jgi:hypothetical protein